MKRNFFALGLLLIALAVFLASCDDDPKSIEDMKVGLILTEAKDDLGWGEIGYNGVEGFTSDVGAELELKEYVTPNDAAAVMESLIADDDCTVIVAHGIEYLDAVKQVAGENKEVEFFINTSSVIDDSDMHEYGDNINGVILNGVDQGYLQGVVAGTLTKTNKIGAVGGTEIGAFRDIFAGYKAGAESVNPNVKVEISYTGSMDNVDLVKNQAMAYYDSGADVVMSIANAATAGVYEASEEKGNVYSISSMAGDFEKKTLAAIGESFFVQAIVSALTEYSLNIDTWENKTMIYGVIDNTEYDVYVSLRFNDQLASQEDIKRANEAVNKAVADIKSGALVTVDKVK